MEVMKRFFGKTINSCIVIAFTSLALTIIALEILAYSSIRELVAINSIRDNIYNIREAQMGMKSASAEFILREKSNEEFFKTGKSLHLNRYRANLSRMLDNMRILSSQLSEVNIDPAELGDLQRLVLKYDSTFIKIVISLQERGYEQYGLIGEFDNSIDDLLKYDFGVDKSSVINMQLYVKDYLLKGDSTIINNISNEVFMFTMVLEKYISDDEVTNVSKILQNYESVFLRLRTTDNALGIYTGKGLYGKLFSISDEIDKVVTLPHLTTEVNNVYVSNINMLYGSFFVIVGVAVVVAFVFHGRVYRNVVLPIKRMRHQVFRMSKGEEPEMGRFTSKLTDLNQMTSALEGLITGIKNYREFANNIEQGNLNATFVPLSDKDSLGISLLAMRDSISKSSDKDRKRNWIIQGQAALASVLGKRAISDAEFFNTVLQFIVGYIKCNQAALFLVKDEGQENWLELVACYAWGKRKFIEKRINPGEGLAGQCFLEKATVFCTSIPDDFIKITSGLGEAKPRAILIVPLLLDNRVLGVMELASFAIFQRYEIDLIENFAESLALIVYNESQKWMIEARVKESQLEAEKMYERERKLLSRIDALENTLRLMDEGKLV